MKRLKRWVAEALLECERRANGTTFQPELKAMLHRWRNGA